jgi:DNA polymerase III subunit delta
MKIYPDQLEKQLQKSLLPPYWLSGDEPLQMRDASDLIRAACRAQGFTERELHDVDSGFDWQELSTANQSQSLFADKKLIELRLRSSKLDDEAKKALIAYLDDPAPDNLLLIISPRVEAASTKTQWFRKIGDTAAFVQFYQVDAEKLPPWIDQQLKKRNLTADHNAIELLAERVEGNLLAADQEIEKLSLLFGPGKHLTVDLVARSVADNARFSVFTLIDISLAGNAVKAVRTLRRLRDEGSQALPINAMLAKELRTLASLSERIAKGENRMKLFQSHQVWKNRESLVSKALKRINADMANRLLADARQIDLAIKGMCPVPVWHLLEQLVLQISLADTR